ncbi:TPA: hypothetical protein I7730_14300 [Vibrio vulnificus]|uniref:Flagellar secretion chaperone FliS n=1 Tax=Vibrio vulnificus TaxID=672 RepID=A0A8H9N196_VIBVL|nr:flagellar protein FliS [Vibrio vulnificus]HAS8540958.1 hypothetical protein [Vibrio vulnificus]
MNSKFSKYRRNQLSELQGQSKFQLVARLYTEMIRRLERCEYLYSNKLSFTSNDFFKGKSESLGKVIQISQYLIETSDSSADEEISMLFIKMYSYIYQNAKLANNSLDADALRRAKAMAIKLPEVWETIPQDKRF